MLSLPREIFVPEDKRALAYLDLDLDVGISGSKRFLIKPMLTARLLQAAEIRSTDKVLIAGCATGYVTALAARLAAKVVATESDSALAARGKDILSKLGLGPGTTQISPQQAQQIQPAAVESAAGEDFLSYMQQRVFAPLGLVHTTADQNTEIVEQRSWFYELPKDGAVENAPYVDNSYKWAGGGFLSTAEDSVHFGSALLEPGFLKQETLRTMFTSQKTKSGEETGYGIGWAVHKSKSGKLIYEHSGGSVGGTSQLILYPETHLVVAMVNNLSNGPWKREEVEAVAEEFAGKAR